MSGEMCRDLGHRWKVIASKYLRGLGYYLQLTQCDTCGTARSRRIDVRGYPIGSSYSYPEGYLRPPGSGRMRSPERAEMRLALLHEQEHVSWGDVPINEMESQ